MSSSSASRTTCTTRPSRRPWPPGRRSSCTKPLGRNADEARRILETVERAGVFGGYLEDLCYTPKALKAMAAVEAGAVGDVTWVRSRETHPGPHSAWFWDGRLTGGGAIVDLGCHCIEVIRGFVGKGNRPLEVMCHTDTLVHPIADEDNAIALIRFESGAIGQFEVSWTFRGGMDLRDEIAGTDGTIWLNHFLRTGFEMFTAGGAQRLRRREGGDERRVALPARRRARASSASSTCSPTCSTRMEAGREPRETLYDGYVVNAVMDACYRSAKSRAWEPVELFEWRGGETPRIGTSAGDGRRQGRHQARAPARRPPEADRQGSRVPATSPTSSSPPATGLSAPGGRLVERLLRSAQPDQARHAPRARRAARRPSTRRP